MQPWEEDDTFLSKWLNDELSEEEKTAFESTAEGKEFKDLIIASRALQIPEYDTHKHFSEVKKRLEQKPEQKVISMNPVLKSLLVAASILIPVALYLILRSGATTMQTGVGEQLAVWLPDSSKVTLHSNSKLTFTEDEWPEERNINLEGEAFFEVRKGNTFQVNTNTGVITVLGTSFNVKSRNTLLDVVCYTGTVSVVQASINEIINAGEHIRVDNNQVVLQAQHAESAPQWLEGKTSFDNVSLKEALEELQNIYGIQIVYDNLPDVNYSGTLPHNDATLAIKLLFDPLNIAYEYDESTQVLKLK